MYYRFSTAMHALASSNIESLVGYFHLLSGQSIVGPIHFEPTWDHSFFLENFFLILFSFLTGSYNLCNYMYIHTKIISLQRSLSSIVVIFYCTALQEVRQLLSLERGTGYIVGKVSNLNVTDTDIRSLNGTRWVTDQVCIPVLQLKSLTFSGYIFCHNSIH